MDKTLFFDSLPSSGIHTASRTDVMTGGKGANVARVLRALGCTCRLWMPLAGEQGALCARLLREEGLTFSACETSGQTREIVTLVGADWRQLAVKEPGPVLTGDEAEHVREAALSFVSEPALTLLAICGGASCPALNPLGGALVRAARKRGIPVLLDASGETLRLGLAERPDWCKPNLDEAWALGCVGGAVDVLRQLNASAPLLTMGGDGLWTLEDGVPLRVLAPTVQEVNPVGSGDSFVAGFLCARERGQSFREALALGSACGAANAGEWRAACVQPDVVRTLLPKVRFESAPIV